MKSYAILLLSLPLTLYSVASYAQPQILKPGKTLEKRVLKKEKHLYSLSLEKGGYAEFVVEQKGVDLAIDVIDPAGKKIKTFDSPNGPNGPEPVAFAAAVTGNYKAYVYPLVDESMPAAEKEKWAEKNQGDYGINGIVILNAKAYQQKLAKEKDVLAWVKRNANTIVKPDLAIAAKIFDVQPNQQEIDSLYEIVKGYNSSLKQMHTLSLTNSVPMSLWQSPVLPNMHFNDTQVSPDWQVPSTVQLPTNKNDLAFYSLLQLASLLKNKKISSVALTTFFLERLKRFGDTLQCVISLTEDIALQQARQADAEIAAGKYRGPLLGIPYGLKDLFAVRGTKTTWGAAPYKDQTIDEDSYVFTKLKDAGAVLVAKLSMGALANGDEWYGGRTHNPWDLKSGSSGSSAGSAAATAAGLVPFAIGTETLGSIISPSSTCGVTGLRPSFGSISRTGAMTLSWSMDKIGPICRSAEDAAIVYAFLHGSDGKDMAAVNRPFNYRSTIDLTKLRIGYVKNSFSASDSMSNEWQALNAFRKLGVTPVPVDFPDSTVTKLNPWTIAQTVMYAEAAAAFDEFTRYNIDDQMTGQKRFDWPNLFRMARFISAVDYINVNRHRYLLMQAMDKMLSRFDVIICGTYDLLVETNLTGQPALSLPTGFNKEHLPASITLVGRLYDEATLLELGKLYQDNTPWNKTHPEIFK